MVIGFRIDRESGYFLIPAALQSGKNKSATNLIHVTCGLAWRTDWVLAVDHSGSWISCESWCRFRIGPVLMFGP